VGPTSKGENGLGQGNLFSDDETLSKRPGDTLPLYTPALKQAMADEAPAQTDAKSRLIASYIAKFQLVTGGGLYIDGFAAPQSRAHKDAWTARRVLEIAPPRLRTFWLCDRDPAGVEMLRELKSQHHGNPKSRRVFVYHGDFNERVDEIIRSGRIKKRTAVFAFLDQRTAECHWATVERLAAFKGRTRIEQLYFLGVSWLHRSLTQSKTPDRLSELDQWWGSRGWERLRDMTQIELSETVAHRFKTELGYAHTNWWPIYLKEGSRRTAFTLIHASDHPEAPKLMRRSFQEIYGYREGSPTDGQDDFFGERPPGGMLRGR